MMAATLFNFAVWLGLAILSVAFLMTVYRVVKGPTLADRVVALDMLVGIVIGFIAIIAAKTGFTLYIDIAIALGLVGFLATVAFARFILSRQTADEEGGKSNGERAAKRTHATARKVR
ncbi:cation:proton antiporter [Rhizobium lemnae]|uniref:Cation:proton antiporter n=1 Tax=Rhizobium lemnae TaxID=1214924 RepID=A0ABV8E2I5_9HYPH|nr:cation:proton antiporter [Rhizobium lemnae]MCJ8507535.1 cation:proton antiporter [Rhizobium lemnae]